MANLKKNLVSDEALAGAFVSKAEPNLGESPSGYEDPGPSNARVGSLERFQKATKQPNATIQDLYRTQKALQDRGFDIGAQAPDLIWGPKSEAAFKEWLEKEGHKSERMDKVVRDEGGTKVVGGEMAIRDFDGPDSIKEAGDELVMDSEKPPTPVEKPVAEPEPEIEPAPRTTNLDYIAAKSMMAEKLASPDFAGEDIVQKTPGGTWKFRRLANGDLLVVDAPPATYDNGKSPIGVRAQVGTELHNKMLENLGIPNLGEAPVELPMESPQTDQELEKVMP